MQLNQNIKLIRGLSGVKQQVFADAIGTNLSNLKTYESTDVRPKENIILRIAEIAGIEVNDLEKKKLTHKSITIDHSKLKKAKKVVSHGSDVNELSESLVYHDKYIALLEKENEKKSEIITLSLTELLTGQRISQAHLKTLLQITVTETASMQGKDPGEALDAANKVVAETFSLILKTGSDGGS